MLIDLLNKITYMCITMHKNNIGLYRNTLNYKVIQSI